MTKVIFITPEDFRENTVVEDNVESDIIIQQIVIAQDLEIQPLVGTDLYNRLMTDVSGGTVTGDYLTLLEEYVLPTLLQYTLYNITPYIHYSFTNKSISVKDWDEGEPIDKDELIYLRNNILNTAEWYGKRLVDYLCDNSTLFPEYSTNSGSDISPSTKTFKSSIFTPRPNQDGCSSLY